MDYYSNGTAYQTVSPISCYFSHKGKRAYRYISLPSPGAFYSVTEPLYGLQNAY